MRNFSGEVLVLMFEVINADLDDLRFLDKKGVICGLKFKKVREKIDISKNKFIISHTDKDCVYEN